MLAPSQALDLKDRILFITRGGKTKRFHTADTLTSQTVAEHSFGVAWLCHLLYPTARKELLLAALSHDLAEHRVGDVSSVVKKANPSLRDTLQSMEERLLHEHGFNFEDGLTEYEAKVLKMADLIDGMLFCLRERAMGSRMVLEIYENFYNYVQQREPDERVGDVINAINNMWKELNNGR